MRLSRPRLGSGDSAWIRYSGVGTCDIDSRTSERDEPAPDRRPLIHCFNHATAGLALGKRSELLYRNVPCAPIASLLAVSLNQCRVDSQSLARTTARSRSSTEYPGLLAPTMKGDCRESTLRG